MRRRAQQDQLDQLENELINTLIQISETATAISKQSDGLLSTPQGAEYIGNMSDLEEGYLVDLIEDAKEIRTFLSRAYSLFDALHDNLTE